MAQVGDDSFCIVVAQFAGVGVGHDDQPAPVAVDAVANGSENLAIRPPAERPGGREIWGYERSNRHGQVFADVVAASEQPSLGMAAAAKTVGDFFTAQDLLRCAGDRHGHKRRGAGMACWSRTPRLSLRSSRTSGRLQAKNVRLI